MKTNPLVDKDTEKEIVKMRKKGLSMSDIASELNLSENHNLLANQNIPRLLKSS